MTAFVYVNTSRQVGGVQHIKVSANQDAADGALPCPLTPNRSQWHVGVA